MAESKTRVQLSLGSNAGDRGAMLRAALADLARLPDVELLKVSHCYETEPLGRTDQPAFYNLAAEIGTALGPLELFLDMISVPCRHLGSMLACHQHREFFIKQADVVIILRGCAQGHFTGTEPV